MQELFGFGLWAEVAQEPFYGVVNGEAGPPLSPFSGRIASRLPGVESSIDLPVRIERAESRLRPVLFVLDENHELARLRRHGITLEQAMSIFHAAEF